jgi:hypothetical protein
MGHYANECTEPKKKKNVPENAAACVLIWSSDGDDEEYGDINEFMFMNMLTAGAEGSEGLD